MRRIGIVGGGPAALFLLKMFTEQHHRFQIDIFEKSDRLGAGMPYSAFGANPEHVTNVSANEIPQLQTTVAEWITTLSPAVQKKYDLSPDSFSDYKVLPRLLFGEYLSAQFHLLLNKAKAKEIITNIHLNTLVTDIIDGTDDVQIITEKGDRFDYDHVIISIGHHWPKNNENEIPNYFDSPYPPSKLCFKVNQHVAIRGSSLTAIDALRTLARQHGSFVKKENGSLLFQPDINFPDFKVTMYSLGGLLPALRFHLEDTHLQNESVLSAEEINQHKEQNEGYLSLDYIFEKNFKDLLRTSDPRLYEQVQSMRMEEFVEKMMSLREEVDPFVLFKAEYAEAEKSIKRMESIHWKELLGTLSFTMNYPAKYFSAEDMLRVQEVLKPLISVIIAFVPQASAQELIALHDADVLDIVAVNAQSNVDPSADGGAVVHYTDEKNISHSVYHPVFIDGIGQRAMQYREFPFKSLLEFRTVTPALLKFRSMQEGHDYCLSHAGNTVKSENGDFYLRVPGIKINDFFQVLDVYGAINPHLYIMAVPYIAGYNPDYSGLDFCEEASGKIVSRLVSSAEAGN